MANYIRLFGILLCLASVLFALKSKAGPDLYRILFLISISILVTGSIIFLTARRFSKQWQSPAIRSIFRPYLCGSAIWLTLIFILWLVTLIAP